MKLGLKFALGATLAVSAIAAPSNAVIVVDRSVDVIALQPGFNAQNISDAQNFLVQFTLVTATTLDGADIYSDYANSAPLLGTSVVIRFRGSDGGLPAASTMLTLFSTISVIDSDGASSNPSIRRLHVNFAPTSFAADTYFFGLSAASGSEIGWNLEFGRPGLDPFYILSGDSAGSQLSDTAAAFRLSSGAVPEPASWALMIAGFAMIGAAARHRRTTVAV